MIKGRMDNLMTLLTDDRSTWPEPVVSVLEKMEAGATYSEAMIATGGNLGALRREVRRWREESAVIAHAFLQLEAERVDGWLDEVIDIADMAEMDNTAIAHANLRINTRIRIAEMRGKERYGKDAGKGTGENSVTVNVVNLASDGVKIGIMGARNAPHSTQD
jgi:hypothetical protein